MMRKQNIGGTFDSAQRWSLNELGNHRIDASLFKAFFSDSDTLVGKESTCNTGDPGSISGLGRSPGEGIGYPLQYSSLEKFHGLFSPWGRKESDMTEDFHLHFQGFSLLSASLCLF